VKISRHSMVAALAATVLLGASLPLLAHAAATPNPIRVGIMGGDDEDLRAVVVQQAKKRGLNVELATFNDYTQPDEALKHGDVNANSFQEEPYLRLAGVGMRITVR
jgi:D-methionine transport system substrate-binding protein